MCMRFGSSAFALLFTGWVFYTVVLLGSPNSVSAQRADGALTPAQQKNKANPTPRQRPKGKSPSKGILPEPEKKPEPKPPTAPSIPPQAQPTPPVPTPAAKENGANNTTPADLPSLNPPRDRIRCQRKGS